MHKFEWKWDEELQVLRVITTGSVTKETISEYYQVIMDNDSLPRDLKILVNPSKGEYSGSIKEVPTLISSLKKAMKLFDSIQEAIVVTTPYNTVVATLFSRAIRIPNYSFKIFSTEEAAVDWLSS